MISYKVIRWDFNHDRSEDYDIMPYLYEEIRKRLKREKIAIKDMTYEWLRDAVDRESKYMYWSRCEYEIILSGWPVQKNGEKTDIYRQIKMNLDNITRLIYNDLHKIK